MSFRTDDVMIKLPVETTDIKATCMDMLEEAKQQIEESGSLPNMFFAVRAKDIIAVALKWNEYDEKDAKIRTVLEMAKRDKRTMAIVTINDCRMKPMPVDTKIEDIHVTDGEISEDESNPEAVVMSVGGKGFKPWTIIAPYHRDGNKIIWDEQIESDECQGRVVPDYPQEKVI